MQRSKVCFIIRTQGKREKLLLEAISSINEQSCNKTIIIVNHSLDKLHINKELFKGSEILILDYSDLDKKRGAPLNFAIRYMLTSEAEYSYFCFIDDDDIFYKNFTLDLIRTQQRENCHIVYGCSMKKVGSEKPVHGFGKRPIFELLVNNFIPINSYLITYEIYKKNPIFFDEDLDFLEDWKFLIEAYSSDYRFVFCDKYVSEFRQHVDGSNSLNLLTQKKWKECEKFIESVICSRFFGKYSNDYIDFVNEIRRKREIDFQNASMISLNKKPSVFEKILNRLSRLVKVVFPRNKG